MISEKDRHHRDTSFSVDREDDDGSILLHRVKIDENDLAAGSQIVPMTSCPKGDTLQSSTSDTSDVMFSIKTWNVTIEIAPSFHQNRIFYHSLLDG